MDHKTISEASRANFSLMHCSLWDTDKYMHRGIKSNNIISESRSTSGALMCRGANDSGGRGGGAFTGSADGW